MEIINATLGIPTDSDTTDDYLIIRSQYVLSYNPKKNAANWVGWELNISWYGNAQRYKGNFITDSSLPKSFYKVKDSDYTNSGYDSGHLVRSKERTRNDKDNESTFILTNIIPQRPDLNRGVWLDLEYYCEKLCKVEGKELFVIAGGIFNSRNRLKNHALIPDTCFKIIVILNTGESVSSINSNTKTIAVVIQNMNGIRNNNWEEYKTTISRIEKSTVYNFLSNISQNIQEDIEVKMSQLIEN